MKIRYSIRSLLLLTMVIAFALVLVRMALLEPDRYYTLNELERKHSRIPGIQVHVKPKGSSPYRYLKGPGFVNKGRNLVLSTTTIGGVEQTQIIYPLKGYALLFESYENKEGEITFIVWKYPR